MKIPGYVVMLLIVVGLIGAILTGIFSPKADFSPDAIAYPYSLIFAGFVLMMVIGITIIFCTLAGHNQTQKSSKFL